MLTSLVADTEEALFAERYSAAGFTPRVNIKVMLMR